MKPEDVISIFEEKTNYAPYEVATALSQRKAEYIGEDSECKYLLEQFVFSCYRFSEPESEGKNSFWDYLECKDNESANAYWRSRVLHVNSSLLKVRYAAISWDFACIRKLQADKQDAEIAIDCIVEIAQDLLSKHELDIIDMLKWAMSNAFRIKDRSRQLKLRDCTIALEDRISKDHLPGLWGFSYEMLCMDKNVRKELLTEDIETKLINDVQARFDRMCNASPIDLAKNNLAILYAVEILSQYFHRKDRHSDKILLLSKYSSTVQKADFGSALVHAHHLQSLFGMLKHFSANELLKSVANALAVAQQKATLEFKEIRFDVPISKEDVTKTIEPFLKGTLSQALHLFTSEYFVQIDSEKEKLNQYVTEFKLYRLVPIGIRDYKGRQIATIGTYPEDQDGHLIYHISKEIFNSVSCFFRHEILTSIINHFGAKASDLTDYIFLSPIFEHKRYDLFRIGIQEYLEKSYATSIHILIPQIEDACRNLLELLGGNIYKSIRNGGIQLKTFDDILIDPAIIGSLEDMALYFQVLYTDPRGMNLRNMVCHGFYPPEIMNYAIAELVIHSLFSLSLIRKQEGTPPVEQNGLGGKDEKA